ncbi:MAG: SDR family oxidoreductase [Pseudomonadota bacterium]
MTTFIIGASRGIGLELAKQYAAAGEAVIAGARNPDSAEPLQALAQSESLIEVEQIDLSDFPSIDACAERLSGQALHNVIVCAGETGGAKQGIDDVDIEAWHRTLDTNTIGPLLAARAFKPHMEAAGEAKLMLLTSQLAASTWPFGGMLIYSTTKAAMSKVGQILALDWKEAPISVGLMHPGWVQTDMGGPQADITAEESAAGIRDVINSMTKSDSGKFYKWNGDIHPW